MNSVKIQAIRDELEHLWKFAIKLCQSQDIAEELVQKASLRAIERIDQYEEDTNLRSWLFSILHSIWKNELRRTQNWQTTELTEYIEDENLNIGCRGESSQYLKEVLNKVNQLPENLREVMLLVCVEGYSYKDAAYILDVAHGTVMSRLARARIELGKLAETRGILRAVANSSRGNVHEIR